MKRLIHATAGALGMSLIASFWVSTLISELFLDASAVASVKQAVVYGLALLVPCMAVVGGSGFSLASGRRGTLVEGKKKRMRLIGFNGVVLMIPMAFFLYGKAGVGEFDGVFYAVQIVELLVGALQLSLMALSLRDGLRLTGRLRPTGP